MASWEEAKSNKSYTNADIADIRQQLVDFVHQSTDEWTDMSESDLGMVFIELASGIADILNFRLDKQALETYLPTAKQRKNVKALLSLINYKFDGIVPARTTLRFNFDDSKGSYDKDIIIPKYTQVSGTGDDGNTISYATSKEAILKSSEDIIDVPALQGEVITASLVVGNLSETGRYYLGTDTYGQGTCELIIDGTEWKEVPDVVTIPDDEKVFSVFEDKYDRAYILLHRNYDELLPNDLNAPVQVRYLNTLGTAGDVKANVITKLDTVLGKNGNIQQYGVNSVTNIDASSGSADRETVDHARSHAAQELTTVDRALTMEDFNNLLNGYPGVVKGIALDWKNIEYVTEPYRVDCYVVPSTGTTASQAQLNDVVKYFDTRKMSSLVVRVMNADYVDIDVNADVYVTSGEDDFERVKSVVENKVRDFYKPENQDFSNSVRTSNLITMIETSDTVIDYVNLNSPENKNLKLNQFPRLNSLQINIMRSGVVR